MGNGLSGERIAERHGTLVDDDSAKVARGWELVSWHSWRGGEEAGSPKASKLNTEADG